MASAQDPSPSQESDKNMASLTEKEIVPDTGNDVNKATKQSHHAMMCASCGSKSLLFQSVSELVEVNQNAGSPADDKFSVYVCADNSEGPEIRKRGDNAAPDEGTKSPKVEDAKRSRIGRFVKDREGKEMIVPQDSDKVLRHTIENAEDFVIGTRTEKIYTNDGRYPDVDALVLISAPLVKAFRSALGGTQAGLRSQSLSGSLIVISEPYEPLYFLWEKFSSEATKLGEECEEHFQVLAQFYTNNVKPEHDRIRRMLDEGVVQHNDLWALFRSGDIIFYPDEFGNPNLFVGVNTEYRTKNLHPSYLHERFDRMVVDMWQVGWDQATGTFNREITTRSVRTFSGERQISSLPFYPLKYHKGGNEEGFRNRLRSRGLKWRELISGSPKCRRYKGLAHEGFVNYFDVPQTELIDTRVVIEGSLSPTSLPPEYFKSRGLNPVTPYHLESQTNAGLGSEFSRFDYCSTTQPFEDIQAQLCPSTIHCFAMVSQRCYEIPVSAIEEINWESDAINHLVLDDGSKTHLKGLVTMHQSSKDKVLKDIIPSKGKGLVVILHGPPGVGKTLTAEVVAEFTKKLLYPINIGSLTSGDTFIPLLEWHFQAASRWDAVLLFDEADVLLEKRAYQDFKRNGIVSVFLRMLEYFDGILFLTTNLVKTIDPAFQSRVQVAIPFPSFTPEMRRQIWEMFINRLDPGEKVAKRELLDHLDDMQEWDINGRQIRNALTTAESVALSVERRRGALRYSHVLDEVNATLEFKKMCSESSMDHLKNGLQPRQFQERRAPYPRK